MKQLRFIFIVAVVHLIRVMITVAIGKRVDPITIGLSVGFVVVFGVLITLRMVSVSRELDDRLKFLATFREADQELERVATQIVWDGGTHLYVANEAALPNVVTPISLVGDTWVPGSPIAVAQPVAVELTVPDKPGVPAYQEPDPESRLARVLKDDYPL